MKDKRTLLLQQLSRNSRTQDLGLYIHIPFCKKRCHFCAFYLTTHRERQVQDFLSALAQEISLYARDGACDRFLLSTIYFGGGTPTSLQSEQLVTIISCIRKHFTVSPSVEITVEADPDTVTQANLQSLYAAGVNRLSFGVQSLEDSEWQQLGRSGKVNIVGQAMKIAKDVGFANVSIDMMYGLPGQTLSTWQRSVERVIALHPTHISCYALTIEEGTQFYKDQERGVLAANDLALETAMQDQAITYLQSAGYQQYEVSNFAQLGFECRHNLRYWSGLDYLGLGPSAQSYVANRRFGNMADLFAYSRCLSKQELPLDTIDFLTSHEAAREQVVFGLRMNRGVPIFALQQLDQDDSWQLTVGRMINSGLLIRDRHYLKATAMGRQFMDAVAMELL